jgi:23S rRNA (adenine2503-C2)-methyltransferase
MTHDELGAWTTGALGLPRFRADQIFQGLHARGATSWDALTELPRSLRARLAAEAPLSCLRLDALQTSADGTRKLRFATAPAGDAPGRAPALIESVIIPDGDKTTLCISSQVGCALDCRFCATATLGFGRNLTPGEIAEQVYQARAVLAAEEPGRRISNLVYMGMGEPLHNYANVVASVRILCHDLGANFSQRRITVSTAGLVPGIEKLGREDVHPNLAVSLNATTDAVRDEIMPINKKWNLARLVAAVAAYPLPRRRRVTFEYVLLADVNDSLDDAARLARLLRGLPCKVNLIPWNPHPLAPYRRPAPEAIERFQNQVKRLGLPAYLRTPRGDDIDAACGQLAARPSATEPVPIRPRGGDQATPRLGGA